MTSVRQFIALQSSLADGNTVRDHIQNPAASGTISTSGVVTADIEVVTLEANITNVLTADIQDNSTQVQVVSSPLLSTPDEINVDSVYTETELGVDI